jgi:hypothetical protein
MSETPRDKTEAKIYDALVSFNQTAQWNMLRLAQMRQYLAEHIANALVPTWLHERKAETAGEEIAHVLLMFGLFPDDWLNDYRAEVLAEEKATAPAATATPAGVDFDPLPTYLHAIGQAGSEYEQALYAAYRKAIAEVARLQAKSGDDR